ncbi:hypothetical protein [Streptococcus macacae]|uniref:Lipoprotein n=1 Tax=Streptococcus macacae NCTC 11558 TaxID=764298 RepID=G5JVR9_9STRE|nr:hypothetical protein [Streptococcus macacae]EHJ51559.1 putative lipoprotein [Streptococcus macacae NCTC 11558]SUN78735.1 Uncharacterised protein [Streptococcus macacae NCTC 11558]
MEKWKKPLALGAIGALLILGGCSMFGSKKETLTKEQQDNVVKRIVKDYDIQSIEFTQFSQDRKTGTYLLNIKINGSSKLETTLPFRNLERLNNDSDSIGLNPVDNFEHIERKQSLEKIDISKIKVTYLEE